MHVKKIINIGLSLIVVSIISFLYFAKDEIKYDKKDVDNKLVAIENKNIKNENVVNELKKSYSNNEVVGLLEIPNTDYKAIITQGKDNEKYLSRDAYGKKNKIGNPFLDYRVNINDNKKILIFGHNSRYTEMPFKILENYYDLDYFQNHQYIKITTDEKILTYQIFSVFVETEDWSYMKIDFANSDDWLNHINNLKSKSMYDTGVSIDEDDSILILQTCSTKKEYRKLKKKFLLVISRRVD